MKNPLFSPAARRKLSHANWEQLIWPSNCQQLINRPCKQFSQIRTLSRPHPPFSVILFPHPPAHTLSLSSATRRGSACRHSTRARAHSHCLSSSPAALALPCVALAGPSPRSCLRWWSSVPRMDSSNRCQPFVQNYIHAHTQTDTPTYIHVYYLR